MKLCRLICLCILFAGLPACRDNQRINNPQQVSTSVSPDNPQVQAIIEIRAHIIQVPEILQNACKELDITIELQNQTQGRQNYTGKSKTGLEITIEASSFQKGRTLLKISIDGDKENAKNLLESMDRTIRKQIEDTNPPPEWTL